MLVIKVQRGYHPVGNHAGAKVTGSPLGDAAVEEQLYLSRIAQVEILVDDRFEERASRQWSIQYLSERELGLQDRDVVTATQFLVLSSKRVGQAGQPLARQLFDPGRRKSIADAL